MIVNIVGAGITGLAAAYLLLKEGQTVRVFDASPEVGGLAGSFPVEGAYLEKYYHHIFTGHQELVGLIKELGLEKTLSFHKATMGFYYEGHVYPFATAKDLLRFAPLKIRDRIRVGFSSLMMTRVKDWRCMEKKSALEWLRPYSGDASCRIIWEPLLKMKFGDDYDRISAAWLWNRVIDRKKSKGDSGNKEILGYIDGGYKKIFDALTEYIKTRGGKIHTHTLVEEISVIDGKSPEIRAGGRTFQGDAVLATVPIPSFLNMTRDLPRQYVDTLSSIHYQGSVCVVLKLRRALSEYYWINVSDPASPFVGIIEHTNFIPPGTYANKHLVYLTRYASPKDPVFSKPAEDIYTDFINYLKKIFPEIQDEDVEQYWIFKDRFSQPVFVKNYSKIMPGISTPVRNVYLLNTSQIYPESRCLNSSIRKARSAVLEIMDRNVQ